ncbi:hypothetical protein OO013_15840 [Mangrovivirga sp. M17]|uniref:Secreted protein n=1 Tax=Mangrovivirga halotolerans TaxID=2993936 RepID=A0ABT3RUN4_9BACT|nr:hypothetical protein [Mangrovivirga halotolerans]MCX2745350.1 hypothetical protein [Mangrovivirga halotolerans]
MKKIMSYFSLVMILIFMTYFKSDAQEIDPLTLVVDTENIQEPAYKYCYFSGQQPGTDIRNHVDTVSVGDIVIWNGVSSSSSNHKVRITTISHQSGDNIFESNVLRERNGNGKVRGKVKEGTEGMQEKYIITFKVIIPGSGTEEYSIDPKLVVRSN